jgi:hypothetical protein
VVLILLEGCRNYGSRTTEIKTSENELLTIHLKWSSKKSIGREWFMIGGGDDRVSLEFTYKDVSYAWKSVDMDPFVLRYENGAFYLAVYDHSGPVDHPWDLLFLRSNDNGNYSEISAKDFPPHLAVQNLFLNSETLRLLREHDYRNPHFARTFTARMLWKIHDPKAYNFHDSPTTETMKTIMETYFKDTDFPSP